MKLTPGGENYAGTRGGVLLGLAKSQELVVDADSAVSFLGEAARVLGTPWMILWMERTARLAVQLHLLEGWDSVGTAVNIRLLTAAPMGAEVTFQSEVIEVNGKRLSFKVSAMMGDIVIGEGTHERALIEVERFTARLAGGG